MQEHKLIFSDLISETGLTVNYLDVGARGDIAAPWSLFKENKLRVIGFEPDPEECARLGKEYPNRVYYPHALWGSDAIRNFYLNKWESTSSMYRPDERNNKVYAERHWTGRTPKAEIAVKCVPLDEVLSTADAPDFVKLDTQGSEYEILQGAQAILSKNQPLVLAETWCTEIYQGSPLTHDVMKLMHGMGYEVFDINVAAAWSYNAKSAKNINAKSRTVGFDLLFIKRLDALKFESSESLVKFAGLCELFGFRDYAAISMEKSPFFETPLVGKAMANLVENDQWEKSWQRKLSMKIKRLMRQDTSLWPRLH